MQKMNYTKSAIITLTLLIIIAILGFQNYPDSKKSAPKQYPPQASYWLFLHRKSNQEFLYSGTPGDLKQSQLIKTFTVKTGIPGQRPTPLPDLVGRQYWKIIDKKENFQNQETAPYFLTLDIPAPADPPFGPTPYLECNGQCNWIVQGDFGLHGVAGDNNRLSSENPGSSGCIRHKDEDITYLYNLLDPTKEEIRYYIQDD